MSHTKPFRRGAIERVPDELEDDDDEPFNDEPTQVTKLIQELQGEGKQARQSMTNAVRKAERTRKRRESDRNLRAVVDSVLPPAAAAAPAEG